MNNAPDAYTLYEYSEKAGGMNGQGFSAIAKDLVARGEFTQALDYVQKAQDKDPENLIARSLHEEILLALQSYDELLAITPEDDPEKTVRHLTFAGHHQQAESAISRFSQEDQAQLAHLNAIRYYAVGNVSD